MQVPDASSSVFQGERVGNYKVEQMTYPIVFQISVLSQYTTFIIFDISM